MNSQMALGLAANQIGISYRVIAMNVQNGVYAGQQLVLVNPEIISSEGRVLYEEGCLSVPSAYDKVWRAEKVVIKALDRFGNPYEMGADGLLGECFQHEIDHLNV